MRISNWRRGASSFPRGSTQLRFVWSDQIRKNSLSPEAFRANGFARSSCKPPSFDDMLPQC
jgi:hypothetical protein